MSTTENLEKSVGLAPLLPEYSGFVHEIFVTYPSSFRWIYTFGIPEQESLIDAVSQAATNFRIVVDVSTKRPVGVAYLYQWRPQDGVAYTDILLIESAIDSELFGNVAHLFMSEVFSTLNIRKLFMTVGDWQVPVIDNSLRDLLEEEGCLREHSYFDGGWHDQLIFSISRDRFRMTKQVGKSLSRDCQARGRFQPVLEAEL
ncbi:MAG: GNAT family N-acetyltransferase, partial [Acidimicrobiales bacterium]